MNRINKTCLALMAVLGLTASNAFAQEKTRPEPPGPDIKPAAKSTSKPTTTKPAPAKADKPAEKTPEPNRVGNWYIRQSPQMLQTIQPVVDSAEGATVKILGTIKSRASEKEGQVALGTVVDASGLILTKASQIIAQAKTLKIELNGKTVPAKVFGIYENSDLAMLKVEPAGLELKPIEFETQPAKVGYFLATPNGAGKPLGFGVLSVATREERNNKGYMGVNLGPVAEKGKGVAITLVVPRSPAQFAGLKRGDVITHVDDNEVKDLPDLQKKIQTHKPGDMVRVKVLREAKAMELKIKLGNARVLGAESINPQETIAGNKLSTRRTGFEKILQHDTVLEPEQMGGPILGLNGRAVGINIAKNGRVATYALPISIVLPAIEKLKTGKLDPAVVNKPRIDELTKLISEKEKEIVDNGIKKAAEESAKEIEEAEKQFEAAEKEYAELMKKLEAAMKKKIKADEKQKQLHVDGRKARRDLRDAQNEIDELKGEKQKLEDTFK